MFNHFKKCCIAILSIIIVNASTLPHKPYLPAELAQEMVVAAQKKAQEIGIKISVAVVDDSGDLVHFSRMDLARSVSPSVALKKAETAARVRVSTRAMMENNGKTPGSPYNNFPNAMILTGGLPITDGSDFIGGIGVSGGSGDQDELCAQAGIAAIQSNLQ